MKKPNVIFVFGDQHRAQACGFAGDPNISSPNMDFMAKHGVRFSNAVSTLPVCCPYRASLITGRYAHTHGVFLNDVHLSNDAVPIAQVFKDAGYDTAYIGKWHLNAGGRSAYIPPENRQGFDYWSVLECTHIYNDSKYYHDNDNNIRIWDGYDAFAQTDETINLIKEHAKKDNPLFLMLSWGPPHNPYHTAPEQYRDMYRAEDVILRDNVTQDFARLARIDLAGYYAHITALDHCLGRIKDALKESGVEEDTILIYTSDHGDMLGSQGANRKQSPWDESILVPFLLSYPARFKNKPMLIDAPIGTPDIMPTLLDMCNLPIPDTVEGKSFAPLLSGAKSAEDEAALIQSIQPHAEWHKHIGGREYRGLRTERYTYVRDLHGPWLLYDNKHDPFQLKNLVESEAHAGLREKLDVMLKNKLSALGDEFLPGREYRKKWGYEVDLCDSVPYKL